MQNYSSVESSFEKTSLVETAPSCKRNKYKNKIIKIFMVIVKIPLWKLLSVVVLPQRTQAA